MAFVQGGIMAKLIFGLDVGTTSIGFSVINHDVIRGVGEIPCGGLGVRIFPEARDPRLTPLNQNRRDKRMVRRQLRRRRMRRRALNECLAEFGLLPRFGSELWHELMAMDPYGLRARGLSERLAPHEFGRAVYHLAQQRHFKGRDLAEGADEDEALDEKEAKTNRESTLEALKTTGQTLGQLLYEKGRNSPPEKGGYERRRGVHADRAAVADEFERLWTGQSVHHPILHGLELRERVAEVIFAQRPVFWRKSTLGQCCFMPDEALCPKSSWLSQQRRMLEKLNNLAFVGGNARPLDDEERAAILGKLQIQGSMSWSAVRTALKPVFERRGDGVRERNLRFNLEEGKEKKLLGNPLEGQLADIFGEAWAHHTHRQAIRDAVPVRLLAADFGEIGGQRVVILSGSERARRRAEVGRSLIDDFAVTEDQASRLCDLKLPSGWEPYSTAALLQFMPHLEAGVRFGTLVNDPEWEHWRERTFPKREKPTGEVYDMLPSPADKEEQERLNKLRNPTVIRTQNELRKVVNNLIDRFGKPDLIRIELARDIGKSKREREEMQAGMSERERHRAKAAADLRSKGIDPSRDQIEKWLLWQECGEFDPYSGDPICFDDLFRRNEFEVEHIWPRSKSFDDSYGNKTLCRKTWNVRKANRTPYEAFGPDMELWARMKERVWGLVRDRKMAQGKAKRFCRELPLDDEFVSRQLNDTGFASRQAVASLKRLWPDLGNEAPVKVQTVSGRVTAQLRKLWGLNNILSEDGEKTRADHRHHAVDALVVACADPGLTKRLSEYWQAKDDPGTLRPHLDPPWPTIRADADRAVAEIVVSHRISRKVSGALHEEMIYGDTKIDSMKRKVVYRHIVKRKPLDTLSKGELDTIRDEGVRRVVMAWVDAHGGDPKKAFAQYPLRGENGPEIRKVRLITKQQVKLLTEVSNGYANLGSNHHIAIYRLSSGKTDFEVVSLIKAARRLARREPIVLRNRGDGSVFVMSLSIGETIRFAKAEGEPLRIWRVQKIASKGQISLLDLNDASPKEISLFEPMAGGIMSRNAVKLSIDPIGRIRPAHD
jgi:CRISPR-associated endonuclease Csn1